MRNVEEAKNIGRLVSLTIFQFPLQFPSVKGQIQEWKGNKRKSIPTIRERKFGAFNLGNGRQREFLLTPLTEKIR